MQQTKGEATVERKFNSECILEVALARFAARLEVKHMGKGYPKDDSQEETIWKGISQIP